jgi:hypothetical protein
VSGPDAPTPTVRPVFRGRIVELVVLDERWEVVRHADAVAVLASTTAAACSASGSGGRRSDAAPGSCPPA